MRDPQQRDRQRRIAPPPTSSSSGEGRSQVYAPNSIWTLGVVRDVGHFVETLFVSDTGAGDTTIGDAIRWQRIRYKRGAPTVGQYVAYGKVEDGYPLEGKKGADYTALKVTGEITATVTPIRATWRHKFWIIETMTGGGTLFPVRLLKVGGSVGTSTGKCTFTYLIQDPVTGNALQAEAVNPSSGIHKWARPPVGRMIQATFGYAHRDETGKIVLGWINEVPDQAACDS